MARFYLARYQEKFVMDPLYRRPKDIARIVLGAVAIVAIICLLSYRISSLDFAWSSSAIVSAWLVFLFRVWRKGSP